MKRNIKAISPFDFRVRRVGIVARDYNVVFPNGHRDFSHVLPDALALLDSKGCDTALFSLYSIIPRKGYDILPTLPDYANLKMICLEQFRDSPEGRKAGDYAFYYRTSDGWEENRFTQAFGRINWQTEANKVRRFAKRQFPKRVIGSCCILVCGEINGVKYDKIGSREIIDPCGLKAAIPDQVQVILNPVHDRMSRFEMVKKRRYLSKGGRWIISVWNKGKRDKNGRIKDGQGPPWTVYCDEQPKLPCFLETSLGVDIGIVEINGEVSDSKI